MNTTKFLARSALLLVTLTSLILCSGCGDSREQFVFTNSGFVNPPTPNPPGQLAPVANNDTIVALGNATLNQSANNGVLTNDVINGAVISSFDAATQQGGTVNLDNTGSFTYTPPFEFKGTDRFTYTLTNNVGSSTATVTLTVNNLGWFVNNIGPNGNGAQSSPFNNLNDALAAASSGDTVFVFRGDGTPVNTGPINLPQGVNLVGQGAGLILAQTIVPAGEAPVLNPPILPEGGNTIAGFTVRGLMSTRGIDATGITDLTVDRCRFENFSSEIIQLDDINGNLQIENNHFTELSTNFIEIACDADGRVLDVTIADNTFNDTPDADADHGILFEPGGDSVYTFTVFGNTFNNLSDINFDEDIAVVGGDTSQTTIDVRDNTMNDSRRAGIDITARSSSQILGTISGNRINGARDNGIFLVANDTGVLTVTVTGNIIGECGEDGIRGLVLGGVLTTTIVNNSITNCGESGFEAGSNAGEYNLALRDNTIRSNGAPIRFSGVNGVICADVTGNTVDTDMEFFTQLTGTINVERLDNSVQGGPLESVNNFLEGMAIITGQGTVTPRDAGFCNIP